ncbi:glycerophosphodiester phosphodiesterase [Infirmifilum sp. NZ]|uniref:glycerophosphodiester phosphodiesterase n=1 Tax=Infirmifilum sp. NZ TaxID=2926850 RepID=UPI00279C6AB0|nr:glycerophosphodiester phosphodiesterase [Infirmifilum sp. NZ]UNQ73876.1 glycerophosphodiester phosphodiesterase [Infirmifilum sp. NZ]
MPVIVAHKANKRSLLLKYLREGAKVIEFDVARRSDGALVVRHGTETASHGIRRMIMGYGYLLIEGRDPLLRPSTLEEHLTIVDGRSGVWLDLKSRGIERGAVALARRFGVKEVIVSSGFHHTLRHAKEADSAVLVFLGNVQYRPADPVKEVELAGADGVSIHYDFIDGGLVEELHSAGYKVAVWTVNDPAKALELSNLGVDYIITDVPEKIRNVVREA